MFSSLVNSIAGIIAELLIAGLFYGWIGYLRKAVCAYLAAHRSSQFPELELLDKSQADVVWKAALEHAQLRGWNAVLIAVGVVVYFVGGMALAFELHADTEFKRWVVKASLLMLLLAGGPIVQLFVLRNQIVRLIRGEVNKLGVPVCMKCGYALQGAPGLICSECGTVYRPSMCWACAGRGRISRTSVLLLGLAFSGAWAMLNGLFAWVTGDGRKTEALMAITSPMLIVGVMVLAWYGIGGRDKVCPDCRGTGTRKAADPQLTAVDSTGAQQGGTG